MKTLNRFLWFFLLAFLLGISGSALGSDVGTTTVASKDAVLTQDFSNHLDFRNVTVVVDDRVATLQGSVETYRETPLHSDTNSYFDLNLSLTWSRTDYAAALTTIWARPR
jgi:hypothetical protein